MCLCVCLSLPPTPLIFVYSVPVDRVRDASMVRFACPFFLLFFIPGFSQRLHVAELVAIFHRNPYRCGNVSMLPSLLPYSTETLDRCGNVSMLPSWLPYCYRNLRPLWKRLHVAELVAVLPQKPYNRCGNTWMCELL